MQLRTAVGRTALRPRRDPRLASRLARSAATGRDGIGQKVRDWFTEQARTHRFAVRRIGFEDLDGWYFQQGTGNLAHRSGRFFTVEGLRVSTAESPVRDWWQPIIRQPEVGILGILAKEFDGVLHFLMQAKMEPGNPGLLQLSPTVQATRSNYTKVHGGSDVRHLEHFVGPGRGRVVCDALQSEHGSWFLHKSNRNMVVEVRDDVPVAAHEDFRWFTLKEITDLLRLDNMVNMDARTVLSCLPPPDSADAGVPAPGSTGFARAAARSYDPLSQALHDDVGVLSWFTEQRSLRDLHSERLPLADLPDWRRTPTAIEHRDGRYFDVVAVSVAAGSREVARWTQPLFAPHGLGVTAFLTRNINGVPHLLAHARVEGGFLDTVEIGPTVQCTPSNHRHLDAEDRPAFLDMVLSAPRDRIRYDAVHSEEGGRFLNAESRYRIVEVGDEVPLDPHPHYRWTTPGQLGRLLRHGHYVNVQARTLMACLPAAV